MAEKLFAYIPFSWHKYAWDHHVSLRTFKIQITSICTLNKFIFSVNVLELFNISIYQMTHHIFVDLLSLKSIPWIAYIFKN